MIPAAFVDHWATYSPDVVIQSNVGPRWKLDDVVSAWDQAARLTVHRGACADYPTEHCIAVRGYNADDGYAGYEVTWPDSDHPARIYLNRHFWTDAAVDSQAVTCHEIGHGIGFTHDEPSGCTSQENRETPSRWELRHARG